MVGNLLDLSFGTIKGAASTQAVTDTSAPVTSLEEGQLYQLFSTENAYIRFDVGTTTAATSSNAMYLLKETYWVVRLPRGVDRLSIIRVDTNGTLFYGKLEA